MVVIGLESELAHIYRPHYHIAQETVPPATWWWPRDRFGAPPGGAPARLAGCDRDLWSLRRRFQGRSGRWRRGSRASRGAPDRRWPPGIACRARACWRRRRCVRDRVGGASDGSRRRTRGSAPYCSARVSRRSTLLTPPRIGLRHAGLRAIELAAIFLRHRLVDANRQVGHAMREDELLCLISMRRAPLPGTPDPLPPARPARRERVRQGRQPRRPRRRRSPAPCSAAWRQQTTE
jgi:hypothetical protein